jgi:hypothetical protein
MPVQRSNPVHFDLDIHIKATMAYSNPAISRKFCTAVRQQVRKPFCELERGEGELERGNRCLHVS